MTNDLARLKAAGIENPSRDLRILQNHFEGEGLEAAIERRIAREPMSQILGYRDFWKDRFIVNAHVLDPRPDSELFIDLICETGRDFKKILDLGTGSGALGLSSLRELPEANALLVDISEQALDIAKQNAQNLGLGDRAKTLQSNWFENIQGQFDLILCNPPYLTKNELENAQAELKFEPSNALSDEADGLSHYRHLASNLRQYLAPNGIALFEHGSTQQEAVVDIFEKEGFETKIHKDFCNNPRLVAVFLPESEKT